VSGYVVGLCTCSRGTGGSAPLQPLPWRRDYASSHHEGSCGDRRTRKTNLVMPKAKPTTMARMQFGM